MRSSYAHRSGKRKKKIKSSVFFALPGTLHLRALRKMLLKLTPVFISFMTAAIKNA